MRSFVAIPVSCHAGEALQRLQQALPVGRPAPPENLHVTLAFLDDVSDAALTQLHEELSGLMVPAPKLAICGLDVFGGRKPRLLYARVEPSAELEYLHGRVQSCIRAAGIVIRRERFRPHVTLARFGQGMPVGDLARLGQFLEGYGAVTVPAFESMEFALYGSTLRPEGAVHEVLAEYPLASQQGA